MVIPGVLAGYDDPVARVRLRRMKTVATGLLAVAAGIFLATFALPDNTATGYVRAAAEAGMVGGLADWFAVTALFRYPMRLKIPHTALIPNKKDEIATKLGEFVEGNFVTPDRVAEFLRRSRPVERTGVWLADPVNADRAGREASALLTAGLAAVDTRKAAEVLLRVIRGDLDRRSYSPVLGELLGTAVQGRTHDPLVEVLVREGRPLLVRHRDVIHDHLKDLLESLNLVTRILATHKAVDRIIDWAIESLEEMERRGRSHPVRPVLDGLLQKLADELCADGETSRTVDDQLRRLTEQPRTLELVDRIVTDMLGSAQTALTPDGDLRGALPELIQGLGHRMTNDTVFAERLESALESGARFVVGRYSAQIVPFIAHQVAAWDAMEASDRIETAIGRDLQFIRINGTVVGAIAGVAIYSVAVAAGHG